MSSFETIDNPNGSSVKSPTMEFDESKFKLRSQTTTEAGDTPGLIRLLIGKVVKTEAQAIAVLLFVAVLIVSLSVFIFKKQAVQQTHLDPKLFEYR